MGVLISLDSPVKTERADNSNVLDSAASGSIENEISDVEPKPELSDTILENIDPLSELVHWNASQINYDEANTVPICDMMTELTCDTVEPSDVADDGSGSVATPLDKTKLTAQLAKLSVSAQAQAGQVNQVNEDLERLKGQLGDLKGVIKVPAGFDADI